MFCLKESGAIRFQKRFDFPVACCFPYTVIGNNANSSNDAQLMQQNMIVASHLNSLNIYKDVQLIWSSKVVGVPVAVRVVKVKDLHGLIVTLDDTGALNISYLGTDPSNNIVNNPVEAKELNYEEMDKELRALQMVIREATQNVKTEPSDKVVLRAQEVPMEAQETPTTCFRLYISYTGMGSIQNVNIAVSTTEALKVLQSTISIDTLSGGSRTPTVIPLVFRCRMNSLPNERIATVVAAYTTSKGDPRTARLEITLPLSLFCKLVPPIKTSIYKLTVDTGRRGAPLLNTLFNDLPSGMDTALTSSDPDAPNMISIQYHSGPDVTIVGSKSSGKYRVQSSHFEAMWLLLSELISRLNHYWKEKDSAPKDATSSPPPTEQFRVTFTDELPFQEYFALIDAHFAGRKQLETLLEELAKCTTQFRAVQKRLLVRYKDKNAVPLVNMDLLLESTYEEISKLTTKIQAKQKEMKTLACNLACATQLMQRLIRYKFDLDNTSYLILQSYLPSRVNDENSEKQGWEESTNASLVQLLRTVLASSALDMSTLPILANLTDTKVLKQHIVMVAERLAAGGKLYKPHSSSSSKKKTSEKTAKSKSKSSSSSSPKSQRAQTTSSNTTNTNNT